MRRDAVAKQLSDAQAMHSSLVKQEATAEIRMQQVALTEHNTVTLMLTFACSKWRATRERVAGESRLCPLSPAAPAHQERS